MVSPKLGCAAGRNSNNTFGHAFVRCNAYPGPSACSFLPQTLSMRRLNSNLCIPTYDRLNSSLPVIERLPGWRGRYFHSPSMTLAHYDFARGSSIHEHFHPQEEVYEVLEGELEVTIDDDCPAVGEGFDRMADGQSSS